MLADISNDAGISAIGAIQQKPESAAASLSNPSGSGAPQATAPASAGPGNPNLPNPRLTVDPATARVVYEYFSDVGVLTNSIPSPQQLDAYRLAAESGQAAPAEGS